MHMSVHGGKKLPWFCEPRFFGGVQVDSKLEFQGGGLYQIHHSKSPGPEALLETDGQCFAEFSLTERRAR